MADTESIKSNLYMFECKKDRIDRQIKETRKERLKIMRRISELKKQLKGGSND